MVDGQHALKIGDRVRQRDGLPRIQGVQPGEIGEVVWIEPEPMEVGQRRISVKFADRKIPMWYGEAVRVD